jgi:hypothetical protein
LGSRNGTFVDGRRLAAGATIPLERGNAIAFGDPSKAWLVHDDLPPEACARDGRTNMLIFAQHGLLVLPEPSRPIVTIFCDPQSGWIAEVMGEPRNVIDGQLITEAGMTWQLHLPMFLETTQEFTAGKAFLGLLSLVFRVGSDRDAIEVLAYHNREQIFASTRAFNNLLLSLAERRLQDLASGARSRDEVGWISVDELCQRLDVDENRLAVDIHRARKEFANSEIINAANIIERRRSTRQLRLGVQRVEVVRI